MIVKIIPVELAHTGQNNIILDHGEISGELYFVMLVDMSFR